VEAVEAGRPPRTDVLGVGISAINMQQALATIRSWIISADRQYVCVTNVHAVMECQRDESIRRAHNEAGLCTPDGMPLVWLNRMAGRREVSRVYGPDLLAACCAMSVQEGFSHYFYGGDEGVADRLSVRLRSRFPGLNVAGTYSPPFRELSEEEDEAIMERINACRPDVVWVGLGCPKQERWMWLHRDRLDAPVLVGVGAAFDYHAGLKKQAPPWVQRIGMEWFFRLLTEPRRLAPRYLKTNPLFLWKLAGRSLSGQRYRL
jgi:N-acetylglucosaminyldiphosphoundecaprenol N-acetyl-beta-D-mannosaminyltransferase